MAEAKAPPWKTDMGQGAPSPSETRADPPRDEEEGMSHDGGECRDVGGEEEKNMLSLLLLLYLLLRKNMIFIGGEPSV